ncbi:porin [Geoalkalibacter halelectricus]|uniref:Phosphate-selective porin OprO and OprP n=1 Tax=Geoalkalibacter halelectricus TaxID=2847045 RepID=A0ABY5ZN86_9BACT|nr:porin [Geoalkalibacter halelectricus]MDO3379890.1 porin [Geoalkalibacter halelectricus]UWZ80581.1 hypothetical protein L9S41_04075 [Geoalkalibacter halelectricus]
MKKFFLGALVSTLLFALSSPAAAWGPRLEVDEDTWLQLGFLAQLQYETVENAAGTDNNKWSNEFFTRRARILAMGSVHEKVKFFFDTDVPNAGKTGSDNSLIWNDGIIDFQFMPEINVSMGRILPPFALETQASATTLLGIDYNLNSIKLPTPNDRSFWRDDGVEARGLLAGGLIDYRVGVFKGQRDAAMNPDDELRTTGMIMVNLGDAQGGWFYNMNSLGAIDALSFGVGFDRIPHSAAGVSNGKAWSLFALVDQGLGIGRLTGAAAYYDWDGDGWAGGFEGKTASVQAGYLVPCMLLDGAHWQPVVRWQHQNPDVGPKLDTLNLGLNYYLRGHNVNFKVDYAVNDQIIAGERVDAFRFQTQIYF